MKIRAMAASLNARDAGMAKSLAKTERADPNWGEYAYMHLVKFANRSDSPFTSEAASSWCYANGLANPVSPRAWGAVYVRAVREGAIVQDGAGRSQVRRSICPAWRKGDDWVKYEQ